MQEDITTGKQICAQFISLNSVIIGLTTVMDKWKNKGEIPLCFILPYAVSCHTAGWTMTCLHGCLKQQDREKKRREKLKHILPLKTGVENVTVPLGPSKKTKNLTVNLRQVWVTSQKILHSNVFVAICSSKSSLLHTEQMLSFLGSAIQGVFN